MAIAAEELGGLPEEWLRDDKRNLLSRIVGGLLSFCRRKPLGAFGGLLLLLPVILAIFGPGISIGPLSIPGIMQDYQDYELGKDVLEGPSKEHLMGTDAIGRDLFARLVYGA